MPTGLTTATARTLQSSLEATGGRADAVARSLGEPSASASCTTGSDCPPSCGSPTCTASRP